MSSDEENLDDLLKSVMENDEESNYMPEEDNSERKEDISAGDTDSMMDSDTAQSDLDLAITDVESELDDFAIIDEGSELDDFATTDEGSELDDFATTDEGSELDDFAVTDEGSGLDDFAVIDEGSELDDFAVIDEGSELDDFAVIDKGSDLNDFAITDVESELNDFAIIEGDSESSDLDFAIEDNGDQEELISPDEVDAMFAAANAAALDESPASDGMEADEMLALLDSMSEDKEVDEAALLGDIAADIEEHEGSKDKIVPESEEEEKKKGKFSKIFGKKEKANDEMDPAESENEGEKSMEETPKKQNFFSKVLSFLTEADDDDDQLDAESAMEPSDENKNILEELDEEDKKKKKKKVKGKKQEDKEEGTDKKKEKKEKKPKKKKNDDTAEDLGSLPSEKRGKKISKKSIAVIIGLCLTLTAMIIVLCSIVPEFFDKRGAREAFYQSDYAKAYELLYGKKMDNSDTIIYNKSKIILELNRKLDSYHNYLGIGKEVQALDALMSGVEKYPDILFEAEEYHVTQEVNAVYQTILNILNDKYNISEGVAKVIIDYDDLTYTRKLESIVYGTPFVKPEEEKETVEETAAASDILPEEQEMIEENASMDAQEVESMEPEITESAVSGEEVTDIVMDEVNEPEETEDNTVQEEEMPSETSSDPVSYEPQNNTSDSQGQLIQGVRQPINIEIHGN